MRKVNIIEETIRDFMGVIKYGAYICGIT